MWKQRSYQMYENLGRTSEEQRRSGHQMPALQGRLRAVRTAEEGNEEFHLPRPESGETVSASGGGV